MDKRWRYEGGSGVCTGPGERARGWWCHRVFGKRAVITQSADDKVKGKGVCKCGDVHGSELAKRHDGAVHKAQQQACKVHSEYHYPNTRKVRT